MAEKMKPDKLMLDVWQADAAGLSYGEERRRRRDEALSGKG
jgi:protocatechuate 3,4-dioxygenase beta subunit